MVVVVLDDRDEFSLISQFLIFHINLNFLVMYMDKKQTQEMFLDMIDKVLMSQFDLMHKRFDEHDNRFNKIERDVLDIKDFTIPNIMELKENVSFLSEEVNQLAKGGN
jgi:hypothetical protein